MPDEWVQMTHPDQGDAPDPAPVTRKAFEQVWKAKGWVEKGATPAPQSRLPRSKPEGDS